MKISKGEAFRTGNRSLLIDSSRCERRLSIGELVARRHTSWADGRKDGWMDGWWIPGKRASEMQGASGAGGPLTRLLIDD